MYSMSHLWVPKLNKITLSKISTINVYVNAGRHLLKMKDAKNRICLTKNMFSMHATEYKHASVCPTPLYLCIYSRVHKIEY